MACRLRRLIKPYKMAMLRPFREEQQQLTVISFPKSGRTWLQVMIGEYLTRYRNLNVSNVIALQQYTKRLEGIPRIRFSHDFRPQWKTQEQLRSDKSAYRRHKILLLVRDPRDILVSSFFEKTRRKPAKRNDKSVPEMTINQFVYQDIGGIDTIIAFYNSWLNKRDVPVDFRIARYEDMRRDTREAFADILKYIGFPGIDEKILDEVIELSRIEKMRKMEAQCARGVHDVRRTDPNVENAFMTRAFQPADPSDPECFKVRKGKVGGYRDYLDEKEIAFLSKKIREELDPVFGYR
jgi:hypothetical protein